jgi:hypothetical protein
MKQKKIDQEKVKACQKITFNDKEIDEDIQGNCFIRLAKEEKNPNYCEFISETAREEYHLKPATWYADYYKDKCYYEMAIELNDKSLCEKVSEKSEEHNKDYCYSHF